MRLSIFRTRTLTTANGATLLLLGGLYSLFFFGTLYFQQIKGYNALESGVAFLPQTVGIIAGSVISQRPDRALRAQGRAGRRARRSAPLGLLWMTHADAGGVVRGRASCPG